MDKISDNGHNITNRPTIISRSKINIIFFEYNKLLKNYGKNTEKTIDLLSTSL